MLKPATFLLFFCNALSFSIFVIYRDISRDDIIKALCFLEYLIVAELDPNIKLEYQDLTWSKTTGLSSSSTILCQLL